MFGNKCSNCNTNVKKDFEFCPSCGESLNKKFEKEDYGFLGKNDSIDEPIFPNFSESFIDKMLGTAMKMLENQMRNLNDEVAKDNINQPNKFNRIKQNRPDNLKIQFFVNGKKILGNKISQPIQQNLKKPLNQIKIDPKIFTDKLKKSPNISRKEPESKLKRLSGKVIYELHVPGVESVEDILISPLENSIEIKALSDKHLYSKNLNLNLPILRYKLKDDFLTLELQGQ